MNRSRLAAPVIFTTVALALGFSGCDSSDSGGKDAVTDTQGGADNPGTDIDDHGEKFTLVVSGTGFSPHEGQVLTVAFLEAGDNSAKGTQSTTVTDGGFSVTFPGVLEAGRAYTVKYYADLSGNGTCDAPPADHGWSESVPAVTGKVTLPVTHNTNFDTSVCNFF